MSTRNPKISPEERAKRLARAHEKKRLGQRLTREEGHALSVESRQKNLTPARRSEIARMGLLAAAEKREALGTLKDAPASCPPAPACPPGGYHGKACGEIVTPQGREAACYAVVDAADLVTSHNPETWRADPRYPQLVQERDYTGDKNEQTKVGRIAKNPDPAILLSNSATPIDGPPVATSKHIVLGGNGRTMGLKLAYGLGTATAYRSELDKRAALFGLKPEDIKKAKHPILVRIVKGLDNATQPELAAMSSQLNESMSNSMDDRAKAVSLSRRLSPVTLSTLGAMIEAREGLKGAMEHDSRAILERLRADGIMTAENAAQIATPAGQLTSAGRDIVEGSFLGLAAGTPERLKAATPATLQRVEKLTPSLAQVVGINPEQDLIPLFQAAMDVVHSADKQKMSVAQFGQQIDFTREPIHPQVLQAAEVLQGGIKKVGEGAKHWARVAGVDPKQKTMFSSPPTREVAWRVLATDVLGPDAKPVATYVPAAAAPAATPKPAPTPATGPSLQSPGTIPSYAPVNVASFPEEVRRVMKGIRGRGRFGANKVYIHSLFEAWPDKQISEAAFKQQLLAAHMNKGIKLVETELVEDIDPGLIEASEINGSESDYHFVLDVTTNA
jgi:hypothetical protein